MDRRIVARLLITGAIAFVAGLVLAAGSLLVGLAGGAYVVESGEIIGLRLSPGGFLMAGLAGLAAAALVFGAIAGAVAILGAVLGAVSGVPRVSDRSSG